MDRQRRAADRLAYECFRQIEMRNIGERSGIGDALLDYMQVGFNGGPSTVHEWVESYWSRTPELARTEDST